MRTALGSSVEGNQDSTDSQYRSVFWPPGPSAVLGKAGVHAPCPSKRHLSQLLAPQLLEGFALLIIISCSVLLKLHHGVWFLGALLRISCRRSDLLVFSDS